MSDCEPAVPRSADGGQPVVSSADSVTPPADRHPQASAGSTHELTTAGVGPWQGEWPEDDRYDPELLEHGDTRNVIDRFRYWTMESIVAELDAARNPFHVAIENWQHDMNIGSIVRSANAFGAESVQIVGRRRWNKRGAMVTDRYQHVGHRSTIEEFVAWAHEQELPIVAIDNVPGSVPIETFTLPQRCVLLFGQEGPGLSDAALAASSAVVEITQFGSTRSINASAAAAVAMHSWVLQHVRFE